MTSKTISTWTKNQREMEKFEREVKTLSLYLKGWTQEGIAETDGKVVELVSAGAQEEEIERARVAAQRTASRLIEDRRQNGKISEMSTILAKENPDEETRAQQSIIKQYLGAHLLDPSQPPPEAGANVFP